LASLQKDFREDKDLRLFYLTWPIFLEIFLFMLMGIADTLMLSEISDDAVAGVGGSNQLLQIAILILGVIGNGASIVVAQYIGARRFVEVAKISALSIMLNIIVGLLISVSFLFFGEIMLQALNLQGDILTHADSYLSIVGGAIFLQAVINSLAAIIRVHGHTKASMLISLGMNIIHIIGNYILIFGKFGFPEMGVEGAAISSVLSRVVAVIVFFWIFYRITNIKVKIAYYFTFTKEYISKILKIGIPSALEQVLYQSCQLVFFYYVTYLGAEAIAARQYAVNISMFIYLFALAIGTGTAIIVGRLVGGDRSEDAYRRVWQSVKAALLVTFGMIVIVTLFREQLVQVFTNNPEVIQIGASVLLLSVLLETGRTVNIVIINSLRAAGDAKFPVYIGFLSMVCLSLPLGYFFVFILDLGLVGVWLAISADEWTRATIVYFRWKSKKWKKYSLVEQG
jgi:putative MATE family efflux protein